MIEFWQGFLTDFHFLRPLWLLALIPAVILILVMTFLQGQSSQWARNIEPALLPFLLDTHHSPRQNLPVLGLLTAWLLASVALAGPVWQQLPMPVQEKEDVLIVVMDLSLSMYADDLEPNRNTRARRKLMDILNHRGTEGQTALVVYAGDAHAVTPITDDVSTIRNLVPALDPNVMPVPGSKPELGLELALELLANASMEDARILLMTDGITQNDVRTLGDIINGSSHKLAVMGIGTDEGAPIPTAEGGFLRDQSNAIVIPRLERRLLQSLAEDTGGRYSDVQLTDEDIDYLLAANLFEENSNLQTSEREYDSWLEAGPWLVLLILPLAAFAFRQGWVLCLPLLLVMAPVDKTHAAEWSELWQNKDQRGQQAFENERFETAAENFKDDRWRAASNYRRGHWEDAVNDLAEFDDAEAHYNRGNALAQLFRLDEAIAAYDAALAQDPGNSDALHNKELVENLKKEQDQQEQEQQQQGDQQQQDQQNQEQQQSEEQQTDQQQSSQQDSEQQNEPQDQEGEQDQEQQENAENQEESESEQEQAEQQQFNPTEVDSEEEQSMQQWLGRIQDNPGELLRNKFRQQSQQMMFEDLQDPALARERAQEQIW